MNEAFTVYMTEINSRACHHVSSTQMSRSTDLSVDFSNIPGCSPAAFRDAIHASDNQIDQLFWDLVGAPMGPQKNRHPTGSSMILQVRAGNHPDLQWWASRGGRFRDDDPLVWEAQLPVIPVPVMVSFLIGMTYLYI